MSTVHFRNGSLVIAFLAAILLWAFLSSSHTVFVRGSANTESMPSKITISIIGDLHPPGFLPDLDTIHVGDEMVFANNALPAKSYQIAADDESFTSPLIIPGQSWAYITTKVGVIKFHAVSETKTMIGEVFVIPASSYLPPTPNAQSIATEAAVSLRARHSSSQASTPNPGFPWWGVGLIILFAILLVGAALIGWRLLART